MPQSRATMRSNRRTRETPLVRLLDRYVDKGATLRRWFARPDDSGIVPALAGHARGIFLRRALRQHAHRLAEKRFVELAHDLVLRRVDRLQPADLLLRRHLR